MSAEAMLRTLSDEALNGAIRQLSFNREWPSRLRQLLAEKSFRQASNLSIPFSRPAAVATFNAFPAGNQNSRSGDLYPSKP